MMGDGSYPAADTNFMGELVLYGKFLEIPKCLFYRRMHAAASSADREDDEWQTSFWSAGAVGFSMPVWRKELAYMKAIRRAPIDFEEKRRLGMYMLRRMYWGKRELIGEFLATAGRRFRLIDSGSD